MCKFSFPLDVINVCLFYQSIKKIIHFFAVPPKKPIITDQNGEILESLIGPYNEGDNLHLICEAEEGNYKVMIS